MPKGVYDHKVKPLADRFWAKVDVRGPDDCWVWKGTRNKRGGSGYGTMGLGRKVQRRGYAHHVSWAIHYGAVPPGKWVLHKCDNPPCVNPRHLFLGDRRANVEDMVRKGRASKVPRPGEQNPNAKLTIEQVAEIRRVFVLGSKTHGAGPLARKYGVAYPTILRAVRGLSWKPVSGGTAAVEV